MKTLVLALVIAMGCAGSVDSPPADAGAGGAPADAGAPSDAGGLGGEGGRDCSGIADPAQWQRCMNGL